MTTSNEVLEATYMAGVEAERERVSRIILSELRTETLKAEREGLTKTREYAALRVKLAMLWEMVQ